MNCTRCNVQYDSRGEPLLESLCSRCANPLVDVSVEDGKYRYLQYRSGASEILRHGEKWKDTTGDKATGALAYELDAARKALASIVNPEELRLLRLRKTELANLLCTILGPEKYDDEQQLSGAVDRAIRAVAGHPKLVAASLAAIAATQLAHDPANLPPEVLEQLLDAALHDAGVDVPCEEEPDEGVADTCDECGQRHTGDCE